MGLGGLIPKTDKPNTELLPRFAAASQWLAEEHPDAPRLPECYDLRTGKVKHTQFSSSATIELTVDNPAACLSGAMEWAMEVYWWARKTQASIEPPAPDYEGESPPEWMLRVLESICESLGREG